MSGENPLQSLMHYLSFVSAILDCWWREIVSGNPYVGVRIEKKMFERNAQCLFLQSLKTFSMHSLHIFYAKMRERILLLRWKSVIKYFLLEASRKRNFCCDNSVNYFILCNYSAFFREFPLFSELFSKLIEESLSHWQTQKNFGAFKPKYLLEGIF